MKRSLVLLSLLAVAVATAVASAGNLPSAYVLPGNAVFPEGIDVWARTGQFFVSSTGDGSVLRGRLTDATATPAFVAPTGVQFSAVGVALDAKRALLYIAGGPTGNVRVADARTGAVSATFTSGAGGFLNDLAVARDGDVFVTDSSRPTLWRIPAGAPAGALEPWLSFTGTPLQYASGFNVNGIVETANGRYLIVVQSNTGKLYRIDEQTKQVVQIDLGGQLVAGDGLELRGGKILYAVADGQIVKIRLRRGFASGTVLSRTSDPSFDGPTTTALIRGRLLVVNAQFAKLGGTPNLPFKVSSIKAP